MHRPTVTAVVATLAWISLALMGARTALAQGGDSGAPFAPLTIGPAPSQTRLANGAPGPKYWQNRTDYQIKATLDTITGSVSGTLQLRYANNSPVTLDSLWFQLEQNRYRQHGAEADSAYAYGDVIDQFTEDIDGAPKPVQVEDHHRVLTKVILPVPLKPGHTATFHIAWHFLVPPHANSFSMGREGALYQIGQWYPRPSVFDDVTGWAKSGATSYAEFGDFTLDVTVPSNYIVAAGGTLGNPTEVLTPAEITRLKAAGRSDTTVHIVTEAELADGTAHRKHDGTVTWKFHLKNARDIVWSASPQYLWDATSWKGSSAQAFYRPQAIPTWHGAADMVRTSLQEYAERWLPYPYTQLTVAEGPVPGGQEWPTIAFVGIFRNEAVTYSIITHEMGHTWFPMIAGGNGQEHPWLHEGINTFVSTFSDARRYPERGDQTVRADKYIREIESRMASHTDVAMDTPWGRSDVNYSAYDRTGGVLQMLRADVMGPERFDKGLRTYIRRWAYKHATSMDFFRTMNEAAGKNLDWFWREWFVDTASFDQAIDSVHVTSSRNEARVTVTYGNRQRGVMPLLVRFTFGDSTTQDFKYPAEIWEKGAAYTASYTFRGKTVKEIQIDPKQEFVDVDRTNNSWVAK